MIIIGQSSFKLPFVCSTTTKLYHSLDLSLHVYSDKSENEQVQSLVKMQSEREKPRYSLDLQQFCSQSFWVSLYWHQAYLLRSPALDSALAKEAGLKLMLALYLVDFSLVCLKFFETQQDDFFRILSHEFWQHFTWDFGFSVLLD